MNTLQTPLRIEDKPDTVLIWDNDESIVAYCACLKGAQAIVTAVNLHEEALAALESLMRNLSNIEVLGEWEALDINPKSRRELRPKVDAVIAQARAILARAKQP
jgi:hypothetical protein